MKKLNKLQSSKAQNLEAFGCSCPACNCYGGTTQVWGSTYVQLSDLGTMSIAING